MAIMRSRDRKQAGREIQDLGRALEGLTRDISILNNKMNAFEQVGVLRVVQDVGVLRAQCPNAGARFACVATAIEQHNEQIQIAPYATPCRKC